MGNQIQKITHGSANSKNNFLAILSQPIHLPSSYSSEHNSIGLHPQIYQNKNSSTQYFVKFTKVYNQSRASEEYVSYLKELKNNPHPGIATLFFYQVTESPLICNNQPVLESYYSYYNFRLSDIISRGYVSSITPKFQDHELWYIAYSIFSALSHLKKLGVVIGGFSSRDIYLTPDGEVKIYPHQLCRDNSHAAFFKVFKSLDTLTESYLPPEQLLALRKANFIHRDFQDMLLGGDVFSTAMVLLECLAMELSSRYYSNSNLNFKFEKLEAKLGLLENVLDQHASFVGFIRKCAHPDPKKRMKVEEALAYLEVFKTETSINFFGDNDPTASSKMSTIVNTKEDLDTSGKTYLRVKGSKMLHSESSFGEQTTNDNIANNSKASILRIRNR